MEATGETLDDVWWIGGDHLGNPGRQRGETEKSSRTGMVFREYFLNWNSFNPKMFPSC